MIKYNSTSFQCSRTTLFERVHILKTDRRRKFLVFFGIFMAILALLLSFFGLYIREVGTGNPVGSLYILIGCTLGTGDAMVLLLVSPQRANLLLAIFLLIGLAVEIVAIVAVLSAQQR